METERINCYWLMSRRSLRKRNTKQILGKRFFKRRSYLHHFTTTCEPKGFFSACIACSECWHECKGNVKLPFLKSHIKRLNTDNEKTMLCLLWTTIDVRTEGKSSPFCFINQASCMDVSRGRKKTIKSGQCHPGYIGKHCETRKWWDCSRKVLF